MEIIESIKEVTDVAIPTTYGYSNTYDGYEIKTNKQLIQILINNGQNCCEQWGYLSSNDNLSEFEGAELKEIIQVDTSLNSKVLKDIHLDEGEAIFINLETSNGTLQLAVYNSHNGYYGHAVIVRSNNLNLDTCI